VRFAFAQAGDVLVSKGGDGLLRLWDPRLGKQLLNTPMNVEALRFLPGGRMLAVEPAEKKLRLWEIAHGSEFRRLASIGGNRTIVSLSVSPQGLLAVGMEGGLAFWDLAAGREVAMFQLCGLTSVRFESSGALLTYGKAGLWRWPIADAALPGLRRIGPPQQ